MPPFSELVGQLLGPLGLTLFLLIIVWYGGRAAYTFFKGLWDEHLRVDHERYDTLVSANERLDEYRESNDKNFKIVERQVELNEKLLAALTKEGRNEAG